MSKQNVNSMLVTLTDKRGGENNFNIGEDVKLHIAYALSELDSIYFVHLSILWTKT